MTFRVGLTGGIGCGKSTVADLFSKRGIAVIDSDVIARELVQPGMPALAEIVDFFGPAILLAEGPLNRRALRSRIFSHPEERQKLESILHPRIRAELLARSERSTSPYVILVIPLLVESAWQTQLDRVLVIDCHRETQLRRIIERDQIAEDEISATLQVQASREARLAIATEIISNDGYTAAALEPEVARLDSFYGQLAKNAEA